MDYSDTFWAILALLPRFAIDVAITLVLFLVIGYIIMQQTIPLEPGETFEQHGYKKVEPRGVKRELLRQERCYNRGQECKEWFLSEIQKISPNRNGKVVDLEKGLETPKRHGRRLRVLKQVMAAIQEQED
ncbi:hypothetical protein G7Y89_g3263 [Cudoniella acicularis]|uniref:Uncharacterized protein n=1 Tax=Cudoniella acicularis TaxID=354080 RepID=A0A8H4RRR1_9HELO|nr:hypothetical protein G7Y89_g3263 [Cudoniella acicularis]